MKYFKAISSAICGVVGLWILSTLVYGMEPTQRNLFTMGKRLYQEGVTVNGDPIPAISHRNIRISGRQAACVKCHRASGFGASEGGYYVPPITGPILLAPRKLDRNRLFPELFQQVQPPPFAGRVRKPHMRPAYTKDLLGVALREGKDPSGQSLELMMPRYQLSEEDVDALYAYMSQLSSRIDPGVDEQYIHFATVFSEDVPEVEKKAVLHTMQTYLAWSGQTLRQDRARRNFSPYHRSDILPLKRHWSLSVWTLTGPPDTWSNQIETLYAQNPVFALIGGMVRGPWAPIASFCDSTRIPCLLPITELPVADGHKGYTIYFSEGLILEAKVLAAFLSDPKSSPGRIIQLVVNDPFGVIPSRVASQIWASRRPDIHQKLTVFQNNDQFSDWLAEPPIPLDSHDVLIVWPGVDLLPTIETLLQNRPKVHRIFLPSRAIPATELVTSSFIQELYFIEPHEIHVASHPRSFVVRSWMRARKLEIERPLLQFQTYYALSLVEAALDTIREDFYRDYFLERVERESQKDLNPGMYPRLTLGPNQRYAAHGAFIVQRDPTQPSKLVPVSEWIVP